MGALPANMNFFIGVSSSTACFGGERDLGYDLFLRNQVEDYGVYLKDSRYN